MNAHPGTLPTDEQSRLAPQRVAARGVLAAEQRDGRSRLTRLVQEGAAKLRMPTPAGAALETVLINTAGGLTGGDRVDWVIEAGSGTSVVATTQACEKAYRSNGGSAEVTVHLRANRGARIAWLPQETIVFDRSDFIRRIEVDVAEGASVLMVEATLFGRTAMGETVSQARFRDRWRVRQEGRLVHAEDFFIAGPVEAQLARPASTGGAIAVASVLLVAPEAEAFIEAARSIVGDDGGVSTWQVRETGKLLARLTAKDGYALRKRLIPLVELLNGRASLPKVWSL